MGRCASWDGSHIRALVVWIKLTMAVFPVAMTGSSETVPAEGVSRKTAAGLKLDNAIRSGCVF